MPKEAVLSARVPEKIKKGLSELAKSTDRPISWHVTRALAEYVEVNRWHVKEIKKALEEVKAGQWVSHEEVVAWVHSWGTPDELPMPTPKAKRK